MSLTVYSNVPSLNAQRNLGRTQVGLGSSLARLSSGLRINSAADDAAGMAISETLKAQVRSLTQSERNANDGVSLLQTAEGAMNEISGVLLRMRELAVQASNGTLDTTERSFLNQEYTSIKSEINRLALATEFNGIRLLDGTLSVTLEVGIGTTAYDRIDVTIESLHTGRLGTNAELSNTDVLSGVMLSNTNVLSMGAARTAMNIIDEAMTDVARARGFVGSFQNRLNVTVAHLASARENLSAATSRIRDVDVAEESATLARNNILMQAGVSVLTQANQAPALVIGLLR